MTDEIDELLRLAEAATAAPWNADSYRTEGGSGPYLTFEIRSYAHNPMGSVVVEFSNADGTLEDDGDGRLIDIESGKNAAFIAAARNAIPAIKAMREELERLYRTAGEK